MIAELLLGSSSTSKCRTIDKVDIFGDSSGVALYQLDGNANDTGGNYHGTETAITYGGGVYERGAVFNGSSSNVSISNSVVNTSTTHTISMWFKMTTSVATQILLHNSNLYSLGYTGIGIWLETTNLKVAYSNAGALTAASIPLNTIVHLVVVLSGTTATVYVNGVQSTTGTVAPAVGSFSNMYIGGGYSNPSLYVFNGTIDQVRFFNRAITATEVATLYAECAPTSTVDNINPFMDGSLKALYKFDGDATDATGVYNGTATNVTYGTGKFGQCAVFYANSLVSTVSSTVPTFSNVSQFSVSMWVKLNVTQANVGQGTVLSQGVVLGTEFFIDTLGGGRMRITTGGTVRNLTFTSAINDNTWQLLTLTYDGTNIRVYKNANANGVVAATGVTGTLVGDMIIGNRDVYYLKGSIDQFRFFNKALTPMEVASLYNETTPLEEPMYKLVDPFKDGSGKALYKLDGNALDESGNYNGTATSVTYGAGQFGRAGVFTSVNGSKIQVNNTYGIHGLQSFSVSLWAKSTANTTQMWLDGNSGSSQHNLGFGQYTAGNRIKVFYGSDSAMWYPTETSTTMYDGLWHNYIFIKSGGDGKIYIDGVLFASTPSLPLSGINLANVNANYIGAFWDGTAAYNGSIEQFRIFNKALTAGEVSTLYTGENNVL